MKKKEATKEEKVSVVVVGQKEENKRLTIERTNATIHTTVTLCNKTLRACNTLRIGLAYPGQRKKNVLVV